MFQFKDRRLVLGLPKAVRFVLKIVGFHRYTVIRKGFSHLPGLFRKDDLVLLTLKEDHGGGYPVGIEQR